MQDELTPQQVRQFDRLMDERAGFDRLLARAGELQAEGMDQISAITLAGDESSMIWADERVEQGEDALKVASLVGSYARMPWLMKHLEAGRIDRPALLRALPDLWRDSDPDDTDPRFLALWKDARAASRGYVRDGHSLPSADGAVIPVYRGQRGTDPFGIAWTTDVGIAKRFALTFGLRGGPQDGGIVFRSTARRRAILAYLTGRGESEVIVDPGLLGPIVPWLATEVKP